MIWKIQQATQEDAIRTARIHPACVHIYCVLPSKPWESLRRRYGARSRRSYEKIVGYEKSKTNSTVLIFSPKVFRLQISLNLELFMKEAVVSA